MHITRTLGITALALGLALAGCSKSDDDKGSKSKGKDKPSASKGSGKAAPAGPLEFSAEAFYKDWTSLKGAALMKKYMKRRVQVTGKVFHIIQGGEYGEYTMMLEAGADKERLTAKFKDKGKAANDKKVAKGASVTINCDVSGMMAKNIMMNDCELK